MARTPVYQLVNRLLQNSSLESPKLTRRAVVSGIFAGGATILEPRILKMARLSTNTEPLIILGAGIAGLTAAYRLLQQGIPCEIYEAGTRIGGRVLTKNNFNVQRQFCEEGAEFIDSSHTQILELCRELRVVLQDLSNDKSSLEPLLFEIQNQYYTEAHVTAEFKRISKRLWRDFLKLQIDNRTTFVTYKNPTPDAVALDKISLRDYLATFQNEVEPWALKAVEAAYIGEFGLDASEQSALNLITLIEPSDKNSFDVFGNSDESFRISGGTTRLVNALYSRIKRLVPIHMDQKCVSIKDNSLRFEMEFEQTSGAMKIVKAPRILCTLPLPAQRNIKGIESLNFSAIKRNAINQMGYGTHSKFMTGFHEKIWKKSGARRPASTGSAICDSNIQAVWESSRLQAGQSGILTSFIGGEAGLLVSISDKENILNSLDNLFQGSKPEFDGNTHFANWPQNPLFGGSYSCPRPGQYTTILGCLGEAELEGRFLFAGEHTSLENPGYLEGAVESANRVVRKITTSHFISRRGILSASFRT